MSSQCCGVFSNLLNINLLMVGIYEIEITGYNVFAWQKMQVNRTSLKGLSGFFPKCWSYSVECVDEGG